MPRLPGGMVTVTFSWLHGEAGIACAECGSRMDGREKQWDMELREFVQPYTGRCSPCRNDEAFRKAHGDTLTPRFPTPEPSDRPAA